MIAPVLAAAVFGACTVLMELGPSLAASSIASIDQKAPALPQASETTHELRIELTKPGNEGLALAARLTEDGGLIQRPIAWKLRRIGGETVFEKSAPEAAMTAEPGDYVIEARYGSVLAMQSITIFEGQQLGITLVLNVGGIRVLPRLGGLVPPSAQALTSIYATSGLDDGKLVTMSGEPGEILRLGAGSYRIESRFTPGNAVASVDVTVKPGLLSSVEIDHSAGLVHLSLADRSTEPVHWTISDGNGHDFVVSGSIADVVLMPGSYAAEALAGTAHHRTTFKIEAGQRLDVTAR